MVQLIELAIRATANHPQRSESTSELRIGETRFPQSYRQVHRQLVSRHDPRVGARLLGPNQLSLRAGEERARQVQRVGANEGRAIRHGTFFGGQQLVREGIEHEREPRTRQECPERPTGVPGMISLNLQLESTVVGLLQKIVDIVPRATKGAEPRRGNVTANPRRDDSPETHSNSRHLAVRSPAPREEDTAARGHRGSRKIRMVRQRTPRRNPARQMIAAPIA